MNVVILLYDGFDELDGVGPYRVFRGAEDAGADLTVSLRTLDPVERVTASKGLRVEPDGTLDDADPDLLVVPGGGWNARSEPSAWSAAEDGSIPEAIARQYQNGTELAAVCTGTMLLARAGVLDGRPAVTHAGAMADLRDTAADVVEDARVVDSGDIVTAGGVTSGLDLALHLLEREFGPDIAASVATTLEYERRGEVVQS